MNHSMDATPQLLQRTTRLVVALAVTALLFGLVLPTARLHIPLIHFLPLHTLLEFSAIVAAFLVFATVWHTPSRETLAAPLWIAIALFAAGWLDFAHALSYHGMPDFITPASAQKAIAFWLSARFIAAATLFGASLVGRASMPKRFGRGAILAAYSAINALVLWLVLVHEAALPATFTEGVGVTNLKFAIECLIFTLLLLAAWRYHHQARLNGGEFAPRMFAAAAIAAMGELFFTQYTSVSDTQNLLGHLYKLASYLLIFRAMFVVSIRSPFVRLAEQSAHLRKVNERLHVQALALESAANPILIARRDGTIRWANPAHLNLSAYPGEAVAGRQSLFAAPVSADPAALAEMEQTVRKGNPWNGRIAVQRSDGSLYVEERTVTPVIDVNGQIDGFVAVGEDVTERIRAEDAMRASTERYRSLFNNMLNGYAYCEIIRENGRAIDFRYLDVNPAFRRLTGLPEVIGRCISEVVPGLLEQQPELLGFYDEVTRTGIAAQMDIHIVPLGIWLSIAAHSSEPGHFVAVFDNITDRKNSENTRAKLERQLQQAQKMEALGQLTGGIAHDFNNILAAILGYSNLALERFVPDKEGKLAKYLREVVSAAERARDLIAKMLNYSRMQPAKALAAIHPAPKVRDAIAMMRSTIPASIELESNIDERTPPIRIDPVDLDQLLVNLLINARDAIDGHGRIDLRLRRLTLTDQTAASCAICQTLLRGDYVALEVSDSGHGIPADIMSRIFDPFFTTKEVGRGSGLGLSVVQGILRRCGGHVLVKSLPNRGTVFQLLFPVVTDSDTERQATKQMAPMDHGGHETIWVVDDEVAVTGFLTELLDGLGYRVRSFNDPADLLLAFRQNPEADLVISDQTMPGLNGTDLAQALITLRPGLPVILCTGYSDDIDSAHAQTLGIHRYFTKPLDTSALLSALRAELDAQLIQ